MADLFGIQVSVHALEQMVFGAVVGDLGFPRFGVAAQCRGLGAQMFGGLACGGGLRRVLVLYIDIHRGVDRRRRDQRVMGGECHLQHAGEARRFGVQRLFDREQHRLPVRV